MKGYKVAVVGASGMVGTVMLELLASRNFPITELYPVASSTSVGKSIQFKGKNYQLISIEEAISSKVDVALFSAGGDVSRQYARAFAESGARVIDNSSAWRMDPEVGLIVPEINGSSLSADDYIIANPNCSTIQLCMVLEPLHQLLDINRVVISTYQSISGSGIKAVRQLEGEESGEDVEKAYDHAIYRNCIPQCDVFEDNGYTKEEMKLVNETRKILSLNDLKITATAVRVPVTGGHSEAVNISCNNQVDLLKVRTKLAETKGVVVLDQPKTSTYPMPLNAHGKDEVFVGRIRKDESQTHGLNLWIVSDNLRKGAATNAIQIAEHLHSQGILN